MFTDFLLARKEDDNLGLWTMRGGQLLQRSVEQRLGGSLRPLGQRAGLRRLGGGGRAPLDRLEGLQRELLLSRPTEPCKELSRRLVATALERGTRDNVSALVVRLNP